MKPDRDIWNKNAIEGFYHFSNHNTSNIPNLLNLTVNLSLVSQTKCDDMFSDPDLTLLEYVPVVIIHLLQRGEGVVIYCPLTIY